MSVYYSGQGDKGTTGSQYAGSQYGGDAISKSFDQMSMSDRQSVNREYSYLLSHFKEVFDFMADKIMSVH